MDRDGRELIWGATGGAAVGIIYKIVIAHQAGDAAASIAPDLVPTVLVGALAGAAAMWLRRFTGSG